MLREQSSREDQIRSLGRAPGEKELRLEVGVTAALSSLQSWLMLLLSLHHGSTLCSGEPWNPRTGLRSDVVHSLLPEDQPKSAHPLQSAPTSSPGRLARNRSSHTTMGQLSAGSAGRKEALFEVAVRHRRRTLAEAQCGTGYGVWDWIWRMLH